MLSAALFERDVARWAACAVLLLGLSACRQPPHPSPGSDGAGLPAADAALHVAADQGGAERGQLSDRPAGPPYPIVLAHGFFGFNKIGPIEYYYHVKPALTAAGHRVFITTVDPFNSASFRGEQLIAQIKDILRQTGAGKVNIIGHSQGGLDARYVASRIPEQVGAVFTVAAPHMGSKVADVVLGNAPGFTVTLLQAVCALAGRTFWGDVAKDPDLKASLESISTAGAEAFNTAYPDATGVSYFSVGGRSNLQLAEKECEAPKAPPFITKYAKERDPTDAGLLVTAAVLSGSLLHPDPNDGMVSVNSSKWGTWLGCIPADHLDEVGQLFGDSPGLGNSFDYIAFYRDVAAFLVAQGY